MSRPSVAIITSGYLPVPNTQGGAVEALDMLLVDENEAAGLLDLVVYSAWDPEAVKIAGRYRRTEFVFVKPPAVVRALDAAAYRVAKHVLRIRKNMSFRFVFQRLWFIRAVGVRLARADHERVVIENHATLFGVLRRHGNSARYRDHVFFHLHNEVTRDFGSGSEIVAVKRVLGVSSFINGTLQRRFPRIRDDQLAVLRNAVDVARFGTPAAEAAGTRLRAQWGVAETDVVFLFSGRLTAEKGAEELLEAFLLADLPNAKLVFAGGYFFGTGLTSEFERRLRTLAAQAGDRIQFTGYVSYDQMPGVYAAADVCCLPSSWDDPAPLAVIEAVVAGKPLITTRSGGIPEYVNDTCAIVLDRGSTLVMEISRSMKRLADDEALRESMGQTARQRRTWLSAGRLYDDFVKEIAHD